MTPIFDPAIFDPAVPQVWVTDRWDRALACYSNTSGACPFWNDLHTERTDGLLTYEFTIPADHPDSVHAVIDNGIVIKDYDGVFKMLRIQTVEEHEDKNGHYKIVHAENAANELNYAKVRPCSYSSAVISAIVTELLAGTRWKLGTCEWGGLMTVVWNDLPSVMKCLADVMKKAPGANRDVQDDANAPPVYRLEPVWRVEFNGSAVTGRYLDLVIQRGNDTGKTFAYSKDLIGLTRTIDRPKATALIGVGKAATAGAPLKFTHSVWAKTADHPAKPDGQDWVGDDADAEKYGLPVSDGAGGWTYLHIFETFPAPDIDSADDLLAASWAQLQIWRVPSMTYELEAALLDQLDAQSPYRDASPYSHERISVGDTVTVIDNNFNPPVRAQVRAYEVRRSYTDPTGLHKNQRYSYMRRRNQAQVK